MKRVGDDINTLFSFDLKWSHFDHVMDSSRVGFRVQYDQRFSIGVSIYFICYFIQKVQLIGL